jgi:DNA topoisomerase-1
MRTDSVHLSDQAIAAARSCVEKLYGKQYLSPKPRNYTTKSKGAQESHEAIRPAGNTFRTPQETGLSGREFALYDLIWKRTVASQMADARQTQITVQLQVEDAGFRSSGKRIDFPGFLRAYVEGSDDPDAALEDQEVLLPQLKVGDRPNCTNLEAIGHETQPPARYTEASLVKTLESEGIGRPSTYASIIGTIIDRGYAQLISNALIPTFTAFAVTALLEEHFPDLVNTSFTSRMEQTLDDIATGEAKWLPYLRSFYLGDTGLETLVKARETQIDGTKARTVELENLNAKVRIGKYGPYIEADNGDGVVTASIPKELTPADLDPDQVEVLLRQKTEGPDQLGRHPETGEPIYLLIGTYGPYVQLGDISEQNPKPKRASLPKGVTPEQMTLDMAVGLLSLPRTLGVHPATGGKIQASLGKFGPYVVHDQGKEGKDYRSLKAGDDVLTISLKRALELLAEPKKGRKTSTTKSKEPLRQLGAHPDDGEAVNIYEGPYGPYIKHSKTNVSLPEGQSAADLTLSTALELLAAKASSGRKSGAASTNGKSAASSSTTPAKTATRTTSSRKTTTTKSRAKT